MNEATTQDLDTTDIDELDTTDVDDGTAGTASDEGKVTSGERTAKTDSPKGDGNSVESDLPSNKIDLNKIPKELRPQVEEALKAKDLEWKRTFTRKTQEASARTRTLEAEVNNFKNTVSQYQRMAQEVLRDPSKLDAYRKLYGMDSPTTSAPQPPPKFESVEDVLNYVDQKYSSQLSSVEQRLLDKTTRTIEQKETEVRWEGALNSLRNEPRFKKYENLIANMAMKEAKYKQIYTGGNEQEVLKAAYDDFSDMLSDDMKSAQQEVISNLKKKKNSSTAVPRKSVTTDSARPASDKDEIISRVRARIGD